MTESTPNVPAPKFGLGQQSATPGALRAIHQSGQSALQFLARHAAGDWGDLDADDRLLNENSLRDGSRLLSAYTLTTGHKIWIITEAEDDNGNRTATTVLLPDEY